MRGLFFVMAMLVVVMVCAALDLGLLLLGSRPRSGGGRGLSASLSPYARDQNCQSHCRQNQTAHVVLLQNLFSYCGQRINPFPKKVFRSTLALVDEVDSPLLFL